MIDNYAKPERRPVQIAGALNWVVVMANDGTMWQADVEESGMAQWFALPALPQPEVKP